MRRYLPLLILLMATSAYGQTTWETSPPPPVPLDNNSLSWNSTAHLLQYGSGGSWVNQAVGSGSPPAGSIGNLQINGNGTSFGAYAGSTCTNQVGTALNASGAFTCSTITSAYVDTSIAKTGTDINTSNQVTATHLAAALPASQGGTGIISPTQFSLLYANGASAFGTLLLINDQIVIGNTAGAPTALTLPSAGCTSTQSLNYTHSGGWQCQAITATASPGGTTGAVQYNNSGSLGGLNGTGLVKVNGASAPTVATSGVTGDYSAGYVTVGASLALLSAGGLI